MCISHACLHGKGEGVEQSRREVFEQETPGAILWEIENAPALPEPRI